MGLVLPEGWRGLTHFQVESQRNVLKKRSEERTFSELYILDEIASNVKFIRNLPFSKRLEVCKLLKYHKIKTNTVAYAVGDPAISMYIIFSGSVKVSLIGRRPRFTLLKAGDHFGEAALINEDQLRKSKVVKNGITDDESRKETVTAQEKCELVVFTKEDYDSIFKTELSPALKEKVETLKNIKELRDVSEQSIHRLAALLIPLTFAKNQVIAFQGEEAKEMYFMKSGECRVVMEVNKESKNIPSPLPQTFLNSNQASNLSSKMKNPCSHSMAMNSLGLKHITGTPRQRKFAARPSSATARTFLLNDNISRSARLSPQLSELKSSRDLSRDTFVADKKGMHSLSCMSFESMNTGTDSEVKGNAKDPLQPVDTITDCKPSYTLKSFLRDFERKDFNVDLIPDLDFSDKHALSWNTGTNLGGMLRGDISDGIIYQCKFENWARRVLSKEKRRHSSEAHDSASSISSEFLRNTWPTRETVFLDVGALHPGDFFGEIGLVHLSQRKASILTVTAVEVLVLNKWDFHQQIEKDIVDCLSANSYKNIEDVFQEYQRTSRWAVYKKKLMQEAFAARRLRYPNLSEHHLRSSLPCSVFHRRD